jgi:hypothetical protein
MKKTLSILIVLLAAKGISQSLTFPNAQAVISFVSGTWDWTRSCGGFTGGCTTPQSTGSTRAVQYSPYGSDSLIQTDYYNGSVVNTMNVYVHFSSSINDWVFEDLNGGYMQPFNAIHQDTIEFPNNMTDQFARSSASGLNSSGTAQINIHVYPNPATDHVYLESDEAIRSCEMYDVLGNKVISLKNTDSIDLSTLSKGVYLLCVETTNGRSVQRVVKE